MEQKPIEFIDDLEIQSSSLFKIFSTKDEKILDKEISERHRPEFDLLIKKIILILIGRKTNLLSEKASEILSDYQFVKSLFSMNPDIERLKILLKFEMDSRVLKSDSESLRLGLVPYDRLRSLYFSKNNIDQDYYPLLFLFELTKKFKFNGTSVYVHGGSASYLHILNLERFKIELNDIDFNIISEDKDNNEQFNLLNSFIITFCTEHELTYTIKFSPTYGSVSDQKSIGYLYFHKDGKQFTELNYFINQFEFDEIPKLDIITGINVVNLQKCFEDEKQVLIDFESEIENSGSEESEFLIPKIRRKKEAMEHLKNFISKDKTEKIEDDDKY